MGKEYRYKVIEINSKISNGINQLVNLGEWSSLRGIIKHVQDDFTTCVNNSKIKGVFNNTGQEISDMLKEVNDLDNWFSGLSQKDKIHIKNNKLSMK